MPKRAFIFHGYLGYPEEAWLPWLKTELESRGYEVRLPAMPNPDRPVIAEWIGFISGLVGEPDGETVLVAHSLGCMAVLLYLEALGRAGKAVQRTVLVAGRFPMGMPSGEAIERTRGDEALAPWLATGADPALVARAAGRCFVILSDDDPYTPFEAAKASYAGRLAAELIVEHGKGHFNEDDKVTELPSALRAAVSG